MNDSKHETVSEDPESQQSVIQDDIILAGSCQFFVDLTI
jgi:hypothetical protein